MKWAVHTLIFLGCMTGAHWINGTPQSAEPATSEKMWKKNQELSFTCALDEWVVEQQPGGRVFAEEGRLIIEDQGGCSVWYRHPLEAPVRISFSVRASSMARVSDINNFWMASEPGQEANLFHSEHERDGSFASYDVLQTYYVGMGGNHNTTTRFRRYEGGGVKPLLPEHDLSDARFMIEADRDYHIILEAVDGVARFLRNGELLFEFKDPEPLEFGWFAFRTVLSRLEIKDVSIWTLAEG